MISTETESTSSRRPRAFFDPKTLPWTGAFVERYDLLRAEVERVSRTMAPLYSQYVETMDQRATKPKWFSHGLVFFTIKNEAQLGRVPEIARLLSEVPNLVTANLLRLDGDSHIKPHGGYTSDVLRCHFGIVVPEPESGTLRVADERRHWQERGWLVFDDYLEHEVWYSGTKPRSVLLIDVVRPEVGLTPRQVAERFFKKSPGTRFGADLESVGSTSQWMSWLDKGEFA